MPRQEGDGKSGQQEEAKSVFHAEDGAKPEAYASRDAEHKHGGIFFEQDEVLRPARGTNPSP
jgi:hypothetical protein